MGHRSVGKTCICSQSADAKYLQNHDLTIENTFKKFLTTKIGEYELILVDTAGQEDSFSPEAFPLQASLGAHGYVLVYSLDDLKSFESVIKIYGKLKKICGKKGFHSVLVENKFDMFDERKVSHVDGKELAEKWNARFLQVSAKHKIGVADIFQVLLDDMERVEGLEKRRNRESQFVQKLFRTK